MCTTVQYSGINDPVPMESICLS